MSEPDLRGGAGAAARRAFAVIVAAALGGGGATPLQGQESPRLSGTVEIDLPRGGLAGDLCLSEPRHSADTVRFVLHRGLNVKRIRDGTSAAVPYTAEPEPHGIGLRYAVPAAVPGSGEAQRLCVEYTGTFPVYGVRQGDYRLHDGSNVIAFNGRTLRARGEARWYPVRQRWERECVRRPISQNRCRRTLLESR
jgi:hypothetical protein